WYQKQQAQQEAERAWQLARALQEAETHGERARTLTNHPASWRTTLEAALFAVQRAEQLLEQQPHSAEPATAQRLRQVKAKLEADERDRVLLAVFDRVREEQSQLDPNKRGLKLAVAYPRLKQALADYGLALGASSPAQAAALVRQRPAAVQEQL